MFVGQSGSFYILCRKALDAAPARRVSCLTRLTETTAESGKGGSVSSREVKPSLA